MKWSELLAGAGLASRWDGGSDPIIDSIVEDSRQVTPGACFVAMRGTQSDGHAFVNDAVRAGASAVVTERLLALPKTIPNLPLKNARGVAGRLAAVLHGLDRLQRDGRFKIAGITGTNGKSTFCYLLRAILQQAGHPTALLGTIQYDLLSRQIEASLTTPPPATLVGYLAEAARAGASHAVMEVSSIALDQGRCDGLRFNVAAFSNLTGDHLDYHGNMDTYLAAKKRLFDELASDATAVVNVDDPAGEKMVTDCRARVIGYAIGGGTGVPPVLHGRDACATMLTADVHEMHAAGTRFDLRFAGYKDESVEVTTSLVGRHNVQNCLAAAGAAIGFGVPLHTIAAGLSSVQLVPGRLQRIRADSDITVLVDYAHTDDALLNVLTALRPLAKGSLIVIFGCGGDRDRTKRPRMARIAAQNADRIIVTSDNPRTEDPQRIFDDIMSGFAAGDLPRVRVVPDRRQAIAEAIMTAESGDVVLIAGKGHENYQIIGHDRLPFDDTLVAGEVLAEKLGSTSVRSRSGER